MIRLAWLRQVKRKQKSSVRRQRCQTEARLACEIEIIEERVLLSAAASSDGDISYAEWRDQIFTVEPLEVSAQFDVLPASDGDPEIAASESTSLIGLPQVFASTEYRGTGYSVAIIDTGIDYTHTDLGGGWGNRVVAGYDFYNNDADPMDDNGHGTHVAGIVGSSHAIYTGVAPDVNLVALKVLGANGSGSFGAVEDALQWVIANRETYNIVAVNMSLGAGNYTVNPYTFLDDEFLALKDAGVFLAAASGNSFYSFDSVEGLGSPAISTHTVSVGAVWDANVGSVSWSSGARDYSTAADRITSFTQRSSALDILAPGALVTSTYVGGGYATLAGTSMATPMIAGAAVLLRQAADDTGQLSLANQDALLALMQENGVSIVDGDDEDDNVTNTGLTFQRLDLEAAMNDLLASAPIALPIDVNFDEASGLLSVTALEGTAIVVGVTDGYVSVWADATLDTSLDPLVAALDVQSILVTGSVEADSIDLSGVTIAAYGNLTSVTIDGGHGDDTLIGSEIADRILGRSGNDTIWGGGGNDLLAGSGGADMLYGEAGNDRLFGGAGRDTLDGGAGNDMLRGQGGHDSLNGGDDNDTLYGGVGNDTLDGAGGDDLLAGGAGHDYLFGRGGQDRLTGGAGNDLLSGGSGHDSIVGGIGNDSLFGGAGRDVLLGGDGDDRVNGQGGANDTLAGGAGNNDIRNPDGVDIVDESFTLVAAWIDAA